MSLLLPLTPSRKELVHVKSSLSFASLVNKKRFLTRHIRIINNNLKEINTIISDYAIDSETSDKIDIMYDIKDNIIRDLAGTCVELDRRF